MSANSNNLTVQKKLTMKFISTLLAVASTLLIQAQAQQSVSVSFDNTYDNAGGSLNTVACSDGPNGLEPRFSTFGSLPSFPNIGGAQVVTGFGSPNCGTCWRLEFQGNSINGKHCEYGILKKMTFNPKISI